MVFVYGDAVPNSAQIQSAMATYRDITYFYFRVLGIYWNISTKKKNIILGYGYNYNMLQLGMWGMGISTQTVPWDLLRMMSS
jgi:hypothetical protein